MKIKYQLALIFFILIISILGIGIYTSTSLQALLTKSKELTNAKEMQRLVTHLQYRIAGISNDERGFLLTGNNEYIDGINSKKSDINETLKTMENLSNYRVYEEGIKAFNSSLQSYLTTSDQVSTVYREDKASAEKLHFEDLRTLRKEVLDPAVNELVEHINQDVILLEEQNQNNSEITKMILIVIIIIATSLSIVLGFILLKSILGPLNKINSQLQNIASGEGDLTQRVYVNGKNEFGHLANSFNTFVGSLQMMIGSVGQTSKNVALASDELASSMEQSTVAAEQVAYAIQTIAENGNKQDSLTQNSLIEVNNSLENIKHVANTASEVATESLLIKEKAKDGELALVEMQTQMEAIHASVDLAGDGLKSLVLSTNEIDQVLASIEDISNQTNLLALNASIEAARAGEHGKGFAIVAEEVRKLSEMTGTSVGQIHSLISSIHNHSNTTEKNMSLVKENVDAGTKLSDTTNEHIKEILDRVESIADHIKKMAETTQEITAEVQEVQESVGEIAHTSRETLEKTESVAAATEEQTASFQEISSSSIALSKMSEELQQLVSRFKI
ncbi:methyl-accepting chemotaxis protein [Niallia sp. HCP3S3_B10]|uniref:methyl-accepting chemotaxis protein n=1 Tax=Bacillaceae TaxID=186817 RepID=UPI0004E0DEDA|nr:MULTISPECIES: methyl-accepting chemotaxis protein [unclassified Bacillus (in: firmicutes)]